MFKQARRLENQSKTLSYTVEKRVPPSRLDSFNQVSLSARKETPIIEEQKEQQQPQPSPKQEEETTPASQQTPAKKTEQEEAYSFGNQPNPPASDIVAALFGIPLDALPLIGLVLGIAVVAGLILAYLATRRKGL